MFGRKKNQEEIYAVSTGQLIALKDVEDEVFSTGMMGEGVAIIPSNGEIYAPSSATVAVANDTMKHALGLTLKNGIELLIHVGIDTVSLKNEGFNLLVSEGQKVKKGQLLLTFDQAVIKKHHLKDTVMMIVTDSHEIDFSQPKEVVAGEDIVATVK